MRERDSILALWRDQTGGESGGETSAALATVCQVRGSAYRRPGARMLLCRDGRTAGVISGGCLDGELWRRAREVMDSDSAQNVRFDSSSPEDIVWGLGIGCRGLVDVLVEPAHDLEWLTDGTTVAALFEGAELGTRIVDHPATRPRAVDLPAGRALVETFRAPPELWIFGSGADVVPLEELARLMGWDVHVVDLRAPNPDRPTNLPYRHVPVEALATLRPGHDSACVVMTHRFVDDLEILSVILASDTRYVGVLGPSARTDDLLSALRRREEESVASSSRASGIHAPIGLDIGAETPEEIALSIVSELQAVFSERKGGFLRDRIGPIHDVTASVSPVDAPMP